MTAPTVIPADDFTPATASDRNELASAADETATADRNTIYVTGDQPRRATPRIDMGLAREDPIEYDGAVETLRNADKVDDQPSPLGSPFGA